MAGLSFSLRPQPPFRLDATVWVLRRRPHNRVDRWDGRVWRRVHMVQETPVEAAVSQTGPAEAPELRVAAWAAGEIPAGTESFLRASLTRMLGLDTDLDAFYRFARQDEKLSALVRQFRGMRPPRFPTLFEALVNAVACQQLSLEVGIHLLNRLAAAWGPFLPAADGPQAAFPRPGDLASLDPEAFRPLGFSRSKGRALVELAQSLVRKQVSLEGLEAMSDQEAVECLQTLRGIGRWSAEYVLLRGLGRWHVFPGDDVGARNKLQAWLGLPAPLDYQGVHQVLSRWHPFCGLIYFHFLLSRLAEEGYLK